MKAWYWAIAGLFVLRLLGPETALAFEETPLPGAPAGQAAPAAPAPSGALKLDAAPPAPAKAPAAEAEKAGKDGLLGGLFSRKLDFGLELLYAPDSAGDPAAGLAPDTPGGALVPESPDDVTIRGSVKKRF